MKASRAAIKRKVVIEANSLPLERKADIVQILLGVNVRKQSKPPAPNIIEDVK